MTEVASIDDLVALGARVGGCVTALMIGPDGFSGISSMADISVEEMLFEVAKVVKEKADKVGVDLSDQNTCGPHPSPCLRSTLKTDENASPVRVRHVIAATAAICLFTASSIVKFRACPGSILAGSSSVGARRAGPPLPLRITAKVARSIFKVFAPTLIISSLSSLAQKYVSQSIPPRASRARERMKETTANTSEKADITNATYSMPETLGDN